MDPRGTANPFNSPHGGGVRAESTRIAKDLQQEVRREDAEMASELVALAPRSGRALRAGAPTMGTAAATASVPLSKAAAASAARGGNAGYAVDVHDTLTTSDFVQQKREVGLVRMSLTTKKAEIRKLEERLDRAEKRLRQQQEQLANTHEKFNNFLKFSNLEQDAAVRRADDETRAKHAKTIEIKKLSALINHAELETRKTRLQIDNCLSYKDFLESLAKPQWFYDVLGNLRIEDKTEQILLDTEEVYQRRCAELRAQEAARLQALQEAEEEQERQQQLHAAQAAGGRGPGGRGGRKESAAAPPPMPAVDLPEVVPLEDQLEALYTELEAEARAAIAASSASIRAEVGAMTLQAVKDELHHNYDEKRLPMCFATVDDLLEVFINVEEGNLFLIQNCHELEEELEGVAMGFMQERDEMNAMVAQRTAQLDALVTSVSEAQQKLQALDDRLAALEPRGKQQASSGAATERRAVAGASTEAAPNVAVADMSPEELKKKVEESIMHTFHLLRTGDQAVKAAAHNAAPRKTLDGAEMSGLMPRGNQRSVSVAQSSANVTRPSTMQGDRRRTDTGNPANDSRRHMSTAKKSVGASTAAAARAATQQQQQQQQHQDASMGPVEMLTIIENKLEEYHRYLNDPANHVELSLMQSVMKQSDKTRRRQARLVHLASQEQEQEEKIRRALERSQAPIVHKSGKQVRPRSYVTKPVDEKLQRKAERAAAALDGSRTSIDSDEDGAEFFSA